MTDRVLEARRADVVDEIRARFPVAGQKMTVREAGHGLYSRARRAFDGSWEAAVEAAGRQTSDASRGFGNDAHVTFRNIDAISPHLLPGLPRHMRERQILGGMLLERFAEVADVDGWPTIITALGSVDVGAQDRLAEAFIWALGSYRELYPGPDWCALTEQLSAAGPDGSVRVEKRYDLGDDTGGYIDLAEDGLVEVHDV